MALDPILHTEGHFATRPRLCGEQRLRRKLIICDLVKKRERVLKGMNDIELTWHIKSVMLSFVYILCTPK